MISLDQVLLLQEKVDSAVERIQQLTAENDALRSKCAELTKALTAKTELVSTMESTQDRIETGILNALNRLNAVENSIIDGQAEKTNLKKQPEESDDNGKAFIQNNSVQNNPQINQFNNKNSPAVEIQEDIISESISNNDADDNSKDISIPVETPSDIF